MWYILVMQQIYIYIYILGYGAILYKEAAMNEAKIIVCTQLSGKNMKSEHHPESESKQSPTDDSELVSSNI